MSYMKKYITNWEELSEEQKEKAKEQFREANTKKNSNNLNASAKFFEEHRWVKIDNYIDQNMANLLYHHVQLETARLNYYEENDIKVDEAYNGTFTDKQALGDFSKYGDPIFDALLSIGLSNMENLTGLKLIPTYSYHRLYTKDTELKRHKDRPSCEVSTTLCLGYDISNLEDKNWNWPMYVKEKNGTEIPVFMKPGDMIIYRGCELEHWREPFTGNHHAQVFLHYNELAGQYDIPFDGRPLLGMPVDFRDDSSQNIKVNENENEYEKFNVTNNPRKIIF